MFSFFYSHQFEHCLPSNRGGFTISIDTLSFCIEKSSWIQSTVIIEAVSKKFMRGWNKLISSRQTKNHFFWCNWFKQRNTICQYCFGIHSCRFISWWFIVSWMKSSEFRVGFNNWRIYSCYPNYSSCCNIFANEHAMNEQMQ